MDTNNCLICSKRLSGADSRKVGQRAIATLIASSERRKDNLGIEFQKHSSIELHNRCIVSYNNENNIKSAAKSVSENIAKKRRLMKEERQFNFETMCFFCRSELNIYGKKMSSAQNKETKNTILSKLKDRPKNEFNDRLAARLKDVDSEVELNYHSNCLALFHDAERSNVIGRPLDDEITEDATKVINYILENNHESQFSLKEIFKIVFSEQMHGIHAIKYRLVQYFKDDVVFFQKKDDLIICFRDAKNQVITDSWYSNRCKNEQEERERIVDLAANIILQDIRATYCDMENYNLPSADSEELLKDIPPTLTRFLQIIIKTNKKVNSKETENKLNRRVAAFSHGLMSCVKPTTFLSPLLLGLSVMMHKKYASKALIDSLSYLGFCASYNETLLFEASSVNQPPTFRLLNDAYIQFVFDNVDHKTNTLVSSNTFHTMGGIMCVTPNSSVISKKTIPRLNKIPSAEEFSKYGFIKLKQFEKNYSRGLEKIIFSDLNVQNSLSTEIDISLTDVVLFYGKHTQSSNTPDWNSLMESYYTSRDIQMSKIITMPFVNAPPTNYDTIFTVLIEAATKCSHNEQKHCFVTFDQPLYLKAREIVANVNDNDDPYNLKCIIVRLGGFHTLISFLGSIGFIMEGSGLKEAFSEIYAKASTDKALLGNAFSRSVRGHQLVQIALASIIFSSIELNDFQQNFLENALTSIENDDYKNILQDQMIVEVKAKFESHLKKLQSNGPTAKLWTQYFDMVTVVKKFIEAECSGNWDLHLSALQQMLPYFHATGHFLYAKCAHLYLQDMFNLENQMNAFELSLFADEGLFTIRRSEKVWSGVWSDMTIEQVLMKTMKSQSVLTHGREIVLVDICTEMENLCNVSYLTSQQHVNMQTSRISRDTKDIEKLKQFFNTHDPFPVTDQILSISSGIVGDASINCFQAKEIGTISLNKIVGSNFAQVKFERQKKVLSLKTMNSSLKINNEIEPVNPLLLFQRISLSTECKNDMKNYLNYELSPLPLSLFDENGLRKTQKSLFYDNFQCVDEIPSSENQFNVIDGGFFLHKIVWHQNDSIEEILKQYLSYAINHYSNNACIVFDGYPDCSVSSSTKAAECSRRKLLNLGQEININKNTKIGFSQEKFLSNERNKENLIKMLSSALIEAGFQTKIAEEDADVLIVSTAIKVAQQYDQVLIYGQDIDLLVILTQLAPNSDNIYLVKPGKEQVPALIYNSRSFKFQDLKHYVGFLHAFTGCDTTSCFYKQRKNKLLKIVNNEPNLRELINVFYDGNANPEIIAENGKQLIAALYSTKSEKGQLHELRFLHFQKSNVHSSFHLESLPPTEGAATQHAFRTYHQLQQWLGNRKNPTEWGWQQTNTGLQPVFSNDLLIPPELIEKITCKCETECKPSTCGCRKYGLCCTNLCGSCHGESCSNVEHISSINCDDEYEILEITSLEEVEENVEETIERDDLMEVDN